MPSCMAMCIADHLEDACSARPMLGLIVDRESSEEVENVANVTNVTNCLFACTVADSWSTSQ